MHEHDVSRSLKTQLTQTMFLTLRLYKFCQVWHLNIVTKYNIYVFALLEMIIS